MFSRAISVVCMVAMTGIPAASSAEDGLRSEQELGALKSSIRTLQQKLDSDRKAEKSLESDIEKIERQRADIVAERGSLEEEIEALEIRRESLEARMVELEAERITALETLEEVVRAHFVLGGQDGLRFLLDDLQPRQASMNLGIYRYLIGARARELEKIKKIEEESEKTLAEVTAGQRDIDAMLAKADAATRELESVEQARQQRLNEVRSAMGTREEQLESFRKKEEEIELLLQNLQRREEEPVPDGRTDASIAGSEVALKGFAQQRGKLRKPLKTRILRRFGQKRSDSGLAWDGVLLDARDGDEVRAVYNGQVVYSDWFYGYGQLLVLDHGDKYMSLYGHNRQLHVKVGDLVSSGQTVSSAGATGGLSEPALYFEIRVDGSPDDPSRWFEN